MPQPPTKSNLPPIDFSSEKDYEALAETKEVKFDKCEHKGNVSFQDGWLRCKRCGAGWTGSRVQELYNLLK
jgi:hypothetical protein